MKKTILILFVLVCIPFVAQANEITHAIGNTGYMITEAMWAKANYYAPDIYNQALKLQSEAKDYMRGEHKDGRNTQKAMQLTFEAFELAKQARDVSLQYAGEKVSK